MQLKFRSTALKIPSSCKNFMIFSIILSKGYNIQGKQTLLQRIPDLLYSHCMVPKFTLNYFVSYASWYIYSKLAKFLIEDLSQRSINSTYFQTNSFLFGPHPSPNKSESL